MNSRQYHIYSNICQGALQFIVAKMIVLSQFGPKLRFFDSLNSILHVFSYAFHLEKSKEVFIREGAYIRINTIS